VFNYRERTNVTHKTVKTSTHQESVSPKLNFSSFRAKPKANEFSTKIRNVLSTFPN